MTTENNADLSAVATATPTESEVANQTELNTPEGTAPDGQVDEKQVEQAKTFTQAEVDALVQKRLQKEERRIARRFEQEQREHGQAQKLATQPEREAFRNEDEYI